MNDHSELAARLREHARTSLSVSRQADLVDAASALETLKAEVATAQERAMAWRVTAEAAGKVRDALRADNERLARQHECDRALSDGVQRENNALAAQVAALTGERDEARRKLTACETCDGSGVMTVLIDVLPPDEREVYANVECAECHGLGTSYTADLEKRAEQTESAFAAERQERERLAGALRGLVGAASAVPLWLAYGALYGLVGWWDEMRDAWRRP